MCVTQSRELHILYRTVLLAFGLLVAGLLFRELVTLLLAVLVTVLMSIPLAAFTTRIERLRVPRPLGAAIGILAGVAVVVGLFAVVIPPFADQAELFVDEVPGIVDDIEASIGDVTGANQSEVGAEVQQFLERYTDDPGQLIGPLATVGLSVAGVLGAILLMIIVAGYMAANPAPLVNSTLSLFPPARRERVRAVLDRVRTAWIGWMQGVVVDMLVTGVLTYVGLTLIDLDFAVVFAVLSALLVVIPYFGAIAGAIPPVLFALADSPGKALLALIVYVVVQQIESNLVVPLVMAQRVKLHPAVVAIGVVVVGQLFGFIGLFVAVPILAATVILVDELWVKPLEAREGIVSVDGGDRESPAARPEAIPRV